MTTGDAAPELRDPLADATRVWTAEVADLIRRIRPDASAADAERITALVERWPSGSITLDRAREPLRGAIALELVSPPAPR